MKKLVLVLLAVGALSCQSDAGFWKQKTRECQETTASAILSLQRCNNQLEEVVNLLTELVIQCQTKQE